MKDSAELPLLMVMIGKLMNKGLCVTVVETHPNWMGPITEVSESLSGGGFTVSVNSERGKNQFNVMQPERWKLGKNNDGEWTLWPPRSGVFE